MVDNASNTPRICALSTSDNPFNPFDDFKKWYNWDNAHGYHSSAYLDRIAKTSQDASDDDNLLEIERAIDEIVKLNLSGKAIKVVKEP